MNRRRDALTQKTLDALLARIRRRPICIGTSSRTQDRLHVGKSRSDLVPRGEQLHRILLRSPAARCEEREIHAVVVSLLAV